MHTYIHTHISFSNSINVAGETPAVTVLSPPQESLNIHCERALHSTLYCYSRRDRQQRLPFPQKRALIFPATQP